MPRYKYFDRSQGLFLAVRLDKQLLPGTFEFALDYLIDRMDLSSFDAAFRNDSTGAPAYPPALMLKSILSCYSRGIITSRPIEQACKANIIVKALARDGEPDHDTIAHFISSQAQAVQELFSHVLFECHALGLIGGELFAIDGCKLPSNASKEWSGTIAELGTKREDWKRLMEKIVKQHIQLDQEGKAKSGFNPTAAAYGYDEEYRKRHVERLEKKRSVLNKLLAGAGPRRGAGGEEVKSNITDNESALIKGAHGYIQGYNGIGVADSANQVIVAAEAYGSGSENEQFPEMLDKLNETMRRLTGTAGTGHRGRRLGVFF
jgi:transposase